MPFRTRATHYPLLLTSLTAALLAACATPEPPAPQTPAPAAVVATSPTPAPAPQPAADPAAQFQQLSQSLSSASVSVTKTEDGRTRISVPSDLSFGLGKFQLQPAMAPLLDQIAQSLRDHPGSRVEIVGHTDTSGRAASNQALSLKRAESTRDALLAREVAADRVSVKGMGQDNPVADNRTREGRSANRRIEIFVFKP